MGERKVQKKGKEKERRREITKMESKYHTLLLAEAENTCVCSGTVSQ